MPDRVVCAICGTVLHAPDSYVLRMDLFADPTLPPISTEDLPESDPAATMADLVNQMAHLSADDLQDQVHRRFEFRLCPPCTRLILSNPLGLPRQPRPGAN
jgi:hypothetical protein